MFLFIAIVAEVIATSALKSSEGFTKPIASFVVVVGYVIAFYFLSLTQTGQGAETFTESYPFTKISLDLQIALPSLSTPILTGYFTYPGAIDFFNKEILEACIFQSKK